MVRKFKYFKDSKYSKLQRLLSYFLIFSLLFLNTFHFDFLSTTKAEATSNFWIVSIVVDENTYNSMGNLFSNKIDRYAADIQTKLKDYKVIIIKIKRDESPYKIAKLNEKLYYEGSDWLSQLAWTILVWKVPIPVIHKDSKTFLSVYPYIDFNEKNFIYDTTKGYYEATQNNITDPNPEIWHSIISPNTWNESDDITKLNEFFDKDHDFYLSQWAFGASLSEPYVFYFDSLRDNLTFQESNRKAYLNYLNNLEDISYNRFTKYLAKQIYDSAMLSSKDEITNTLSGSLNKELADSLAGSSSSMDFANVPDSQAKTIINGAIKQFFAIFNEKYIGDILKYVYDTGRYGTTNNVRVDTPAILIAKRDNFMKKTLKDVNKIFEDKIDALVKNWLSRNLALPTKVQEKLVYYPPRCVDEFWEPLTSQVWKIVSDHTIENYFYWKIASSITSTNQCSIFRWTKRATDDKWVLAEYNRAYNINNIKPDIDFLGVSPNSLVGCFSGWAPKTQNWWWNTPLNLDITWDLASSFSLKSNDYRKSMIPLFDLAWGKQVWYNASTDNQDNKFDVAWKVIETLSPKSCINFNFIQTSGFGSVEWSTSDDTPVYNCNTDKTVYSSGSTFEGLLKKSDRWVTYYNNDSLPHNIYVNLNWEEKFTNLWAPDCKTRVESYYSFTKIPSVVEHKSPTDAEYWATLGSMMSISLASDKNRYIDFISAKWNLSKIVYPNFYRINIADEKDVTYDIVKAKIKELLDSKTTEINSLISTQNPSSLSWADKTIYDLLKAWNYPSNIDLYSVLSSNDVLFDELIKSVLWYNLKSPTSKYKYILEHYLDTTWKSLSLEPNHKSDYEIAYLWWVWDAKNMYVKLETNKTLNNDIQSIQQKVQKYNNTLTWMKVVSKEGSEPLFKCWPAEWVPLSQWFWAIQCWLKSLVPPITISNWQCNTSTIWLGNWDILSGDNYLQDLDKNWITDAAELIRDWEISLTSDKTIYNYNSTVNLEAKLISSKDLGNKLIWVDNSSQVSFDVVRIDDVSGKTKSTVYNKNSSNSSLSDISSIDNFISFSSQKIRVNSGIAKYAFRAKQKNVDVLINASIETLDNDSKVAVSKVSNILLIKIRWDYLSIVSKKWDNVTSSIEAGDTVIFEISKMDKSGNNLDLSNNISLNVKDNISKESIYREDKINSTKDWNSLKFIFKNNLLKKSGVYNFSFEDSEWIIWETTLTVAWAKLKTIKVVPSSNIFVKWNEDIIYVELLDEFSNILKWDLYNLKAQITTGNWYFGTGNTTEEKNILEWFTYFTLKSNEASNINIRFIAKKWESTLEYNLPNPIKVINSANASVEMNNRNNLVVGTGSFDTKVVIKDEAWNKIDDFSGVAYLDFPAVSGVFSSNSVKIINWESELVQFKPNFVAWKNIKIWVTIPGIPEVSWNFINILPDVPMSVELTSSNDKIEAKIWEKTTVKATLYDRYSNVAYNVINQKIKFEILDEYKNYVNFSWSYLKEIPVVNWEATADVNSSSIPGQAYIIATASPDLSSNSFTFNDKNWVSLTLNWISQNAIAIDTYYFFNKEKLDNIKYNSLYTVLLGSSYWDITTQWYLGWEIIFNKDSRSLAVTSLINDPYLKQSVFGFTPGWKYSENSDKDNLDFSLEKDIWSAGDKTYISFYDSVYKDLIAKMWLNFDWNTSLYSCNNWDSDISSCEIWTTYSSILLKWSLNFNSTKDWDNLYLKNGTTNLIKINKSWVIEKDPSVKLELDNSTQGNLLWIKVMSNDKLIWYIWYKFITSSIGLYDTNITKAWLYLELTSPKYSFSNSYLWVSTSWFKWISVYKRDFDSNQIDSGLVWPKKWLEYYTEESGIGWWKENKILLEFAGWNTVGDSTKYYQSYSTVNLWDPIVSLPVKKDINSDFDKAIWTRIFQEKWEKMETYKKFDSNWDSLDDIVIFFESGKIELLANYNWNFKDLWYLAYIADAWKWRKWVWDFSWDSFDDIVMTDTNSKLILLENKNSKFERKKLKIIDETGNEVNLWWSIVQLEVFDMDHDWKDDIVTVDDSGQLNILYWKVLDSELVFTKKLIDDKLWIKLNTASSNNWWAIYYTGLPQIKPIDQTDYYNQSKSLLNANWDTLPQDTLKAQLDSLIYYTYNTGPERVNLTSTNNEVLDFSNVNSNPIYNSKTFLKSQYSAGKNITIEKTYTDINSGNLQAGDLIKVSLKITNNSSSTLRDVVYLDSNKWLLETDNDGCIIKTFSDERKESLNKLIDWDYSYIFDKINIPSNDSVTIEYELKAPTVSIWKIQVWLLEVDDNYWDISLNPTKSCLWDQILRKSIAARSYQKWNKTFTDNSTLPWDLEKNNIDENGNWVPDYIDKIMSWATNPSTNSALTQYAAEATATLNKDTNNNGIPDKDEESWDSLFSYDATSWDVSESWLNAANIDAINSFADTALKWFWCWFGWGTCMSMPLNRAPLAPGSSATAFWNPVSPSLMAPSSWLPIFSALTWMWYWPYCWPSIWPISPLTTTWCGWLWAWWLLGTSNAANFFRLYITPTLTWWVWMAACFWWPSSVEGKMPPKWVSPLIPGWNCVVAAQPLVWCKNDWTDGNISNISYTSRTWNTFVNANSCKQTAEASEITPETRQNIINYVGWDHSLVNNIMQDKNLQGWWLSLNEWPLVQIWSGDPADAEGALDVSIDSDAMNNFDAGSIVKVNFKRVSSFPDFIMDWVSRQTEEIVGKLTSLPTLRLILPDFKWIQDSNWVWFTKKIGDEYSSWRDKYEKWKTKTNKSVNNLLKSDKDWQIISDAKKWATWPINSAWKNISGIKQAYNFMSKLPLLTLETQKINFDIPYVSPQDIEKWVSKAKLKKAERNAEIDNFKKSTGDLPWDVTSKAAEWLVKDLDKNIKVLETYKDFPDKLLRYLKWKERYTSQIICNVETIENIMWGYIKKNWLRFKSWVELYILIKAILKSWQVIPNLFKTYNDNCSGCTNERNNLQHFMIKLISALIPSIPIITFPKWPDIVLDLHMIRAGLNILMPEFSYKVKPMILPDLPNLNLWAGGWLNISLPRLPNLPDLPDLPDLPSLPSLDLPDLPPPPTIPSLFGEIAGVLEILKLVSKVMCIYRNWWKYFTPEWKAWESIAELTERKSTLPLDFLFVDTPQFAFSFVDAIKVASQVNLEFDSNFIVEMAKITSEPFNRFSGNIRETPSLFKLPDAGLDINVPKTNIGPNWVIIDKPSSYNNSPDYKEISTSIDKMTKIMAVNFFKLYSYINTNKDIKVNNEDFKKILDKSVEKFALSNNPKEKEIYSSITSATSYNFKEENKIINELLNFNKEKFGSVKDYVKIEKTKNALLISELNNLIKNKKSINEFSPLQKLNNKNLKVSAPVDFNNLSEYNKVLDKFNLQTISSYNELINSKEIDNSIKEDGEKLINEVKTWINSFKADFATNEETNKLAYNEAYNKLLALDEASPTATTSTATTTPAKKSLYSYDYKWIYVVNEAGKQTRLFEYIDEIDGSEDILQIDKEWDKFDVVYKMWDWIYFKANRTKQDNRTSTNDISKISDIDAYLKENDKNNIAAPNFFKESFSSKNSVEFSFSPADIEKNNRFRLEHYDYIDRFDKTNNSYLANMWVTPFARLNYTDLIPDISNVSDVISESSTGYILRKNITRINYWEWDAKVKIRDFNKLTQGQSIIVQAGKQVHSSSTSTRIKYKVWEESYKIITIPENQNIEFSDNTEVYVISWELYLFKDSFIDEVMDLNSLKWLPLLPGTKIELTNRSANFEIWYFDWVNLRINYGSSYEYYDLWDKTNEYNVSLDKTYWFYYWKLYSENWISRWNITTLSLFSPQLEADKEVPLISLWQSIKVPVYKSVTIDLKKYIDDISGIGGIYVDGDLKADSDKDSIPDNDKDSLNPANSYKINKWSNIYSLVIWPFDNLFTKTIRIYVNDNNNNLTYKDVVLEIYSPTPQINTVSWAIINWQLNEKISGEPIDIYRFRDSILEKVNKKQNSISDSNWNYQFEASSLEKWLTLKNNSGATIATINERTWKIDLKNENYLLKIKAASESNNFSLEIYNKNTWDSVYTQNFNLTANRTLEQVDDFAGITNNGLYFKSNDSSFKLEKNSTNSPVLPNGWFIVDWERKPIVWISTSWNIYTIKLGFALSYSYNNDYAVIDIINASWNKIWSLLYKIDSEFLIN